MAPVCRVCAHPKRHEIDMRLSCQVVNLSEIARAYGISHDSVKRHRTKHLPDFLPAFAATAERLEPGTIQAEAERLYLTTLDALAQVQAGVLHSMASDDTGDVIGRHRVSMTTQARLIKEARAGLAMLHTLSTARDPGELAPAGVNAELDARIAAALDKVSSRMLTTGAPQSPDGVIDVEVVDQGDGDDDNHVDQFSGERDAAGPPDAGSPTGSSPPASSPGVGVPDSETPPQNRLQELALALTDPLLTQVGREAIVQEIVELSTPRNTPTWDGNPAATEEERKAQGFDIIPTRYPNED